MIDVAELRDRFPDLVRGCSDDACEMLLSVLVPQVFQPGARLTTHGQASATLHLVLSGELRIHAGSDGEDLLLGLAGAGSLVGEVGVIEPGPASATVEAIVTTQSLTLAHDDLVRLETKCPEAASALYLALSHDLVGRLRASSGEVVRRIGDHEWMRGEARRNRTTWLSRIAALARPRGGRPA